MDALGEKYQVDHLASTYEFTGREGMSIPQAIEILEELQQIDELLKQLEDAKDNAQLAIIDLEELQDFADSESIERLAEFQKQVRSTSRTSWPLRG